MTDRNSPHLRGRGLLAAGLVALLTAACGAGGTGDATPGVSVPLVTEISLPPAEETSTPEVIPSIEPLPSVPLPEGTPPDVPPPPEPEYLLGADDMAAFVDAYRATYPEVELDDTTIEVAGAQLCTHLMRHASPDGVVDAEDALTEADLSEPGYAREDWIQAFEVATTYYCGEFDVDFAAIGG